MSYYAYRLVHLLGIFLFFVGVGGLASRAAGNRASERTGALTAGTLAFGVILIPTGGFGMLARLGMTDGLPGWIYAKLTIWVLLGGLALSLTRRPAFANPLFLLAPLLGLAAAYLAMYRPF